MPPLGLVVLLSSSLAAPPAVSVPLTVRNLAAVPRTSSPVRGGIPLPLGLVTDPAALTLTDAAGAPVPARLRPIARWYDGSIKWLLADTQVSLPASGSLALTLRDGRPAPVPAKVTVSETPEAITVRTGAARFEFGRRSFGLPTAVWVSERPVATRGGELFAELEHTPPGPPEEENWLRDAAGGARERLTPAPDAHQVTIETANDLRVVVKLSGWLATPAGRRVLRYVIRATACAGQPELRLHVAVVYAGNPKQDYLRSLALVFPRSAGGAARWRLDGSQPHTGALTPGQPVDLVQIGPKKLYHLAPYTQDKSIRYQVTAGGQAVAEGQDAAGLASVTDAGGSLTLALRDFALMHPKQLRVEPGAISCYLWPEAGGKVLDLRRRSDEIDNVYHYDLSLWEYGGEGVSLAHELTVRYDTSATPAPDALLAETNQPLRLECRPEWYASSGAFGPMSAPDPTRFAHLEGLMTLGAEWIRRNQAQFHWDGLIDYGDTMFLGYETPTHYGYQAPKSWGSRGYVGWLCNDGTLTHSLFIHALRTGDPLVWRTAEAMVRHVQEVDTCHWCAARPKNVGGGHRHDQQHWGNGIRGYGTATHGGLDYYLLTGDERALEVCRENAEYHFDGEPSENEDRIGGLIRMWEITGDARYKQKADELVAAELAVKPGEPWPFVTTQHFRFVSNTSVSLLYYLTSAPPADAARLAKAIVTAMDFREGAHTSTWEDAGYMPIMLCALAHRQAPEPRRANALCGLLQRVFRPLKEPVPADFATQLRALPFEELVKAAQRWQVNNVYILNIHQLCSLPYAIAALQQAGLDEAAAYGFKRLNNKTTPFEEVIDPRRMNKEFGFAYQATLLKGCPSDVAGGYSELVLLEDGQPLGPAHSAHVAIRKEGKGRWSHWGSRTLWFSTSDNSDPRTNGRVYKVVYRPAP